MGATPASAVALSLVSVRALPIRGASAVTSSATGLLVVEDDLGIYRSRGGRLTLWAGPRVHPALADLEGITADATGRTVWALAEESAMLVEIEVRRGRPHVVRSAQLRRPGDRRNKGFEGVAYLPAHRSTTGAPALVAVHEHKPRRVCVFALPSLLQTHDLKLPRDAKGVLDDLADVAVDPVTGALWLLSEKSRRLAVLALTDDGLRLMDTVDLPLKGRERPEGVAFAGRSRLIVVTEGPARLLEFRVTRRRPRR